MTVAELLFRMTNMRVLVVGDVCLDRWCQYDPLLSIPSAETGIPRIAVIETEPTPGAAGTVANNLKALGVKEVAVLSAIGDDGFGYELRQALSYRQINSDYLVTDPGLNTFTYTKLLNKNTQVEDLPRVDFVNARNIPTGVEASICDMLDTASRFDVICVSDQAETETGGVVTAAVRGRLARFAAKEDKLVWVDSRRRAELFRRAVIKINTEEAAEVRGRTGAESFDALRKLTESPALYITHGGNGVEIFNEDGETWVMTQRVPHPVDICGAGDSFTAGAACALAAGATAQAAARLGHLVASVTIMKPGTGVASPAEVLEAERLVNA
jgi:rfaE bifunctional protein kinase chain/domain